MIPESELKNLRQIAEWAESTQRRSSRASDEVRDEERFEKAFGPVTALALIDEIERLKVALKTIQDHVDWQANDEATWSMPMDRTELIAEAYLKQELRSLHATIEKATGVDPFGKTAGLDT